MVINLFFSLTIIIIKWERLKKDHFENQLFLSKTKIERYSGL